MPAFQGLTSVLIRGFCQWYSTADEHNSRLDAGCPASDFVDRSDPPICSGVSPGIGTAQSRAGGKAPGRPKPTRGVQASYPAEEGSPPAIHAGLPSSVGRAIKIPRGMAGLLSVDAARHRQEMAHDRLPTPALSRGRATTRTALLSI